jgi:hypothetical protein
VTEIDAVPAAWTLQRGCDPHETARAPLDQLRPPDIRVAVAVGTGDTIGVRVVRGVAPGRARPGSGHSGSGWLDPHPIRAAQRAER